MASSASSAQHIGIKELYSPSNGVAEVDIVAVHGLGGDALKTWTSPTSQICWLSNPQLLPRFVKNARILSWGYNANFHSYHGRTTSSDRILQHAQSLIPQLQADRDLEGAGNRPIIFLCHSLGGIIVKRALSYAAGCTAPSTAHYQSIFVCTHSILFFGTPHLGSSQARTLQRLQKLVSLTVPKRLLQTESGLIRALEENSEILQDVTVQFATIMSRFRLYFFWEQEKTELKTTKDYIVEMTSAAPDYPGTERCGIAADHREMCRFDDPKSPAFRTVAEAIRRYAKDAPTVIQGRLMQSVQTMQAARQFEAFELLRPLQSPIVLMQPTYAQPYIAQTTYSESWYMEPSEAQRPPARKAYWE